MPRPTLTIDVLVHPEDLRRQLEHDVRDGLTRDRKSLPPTWFYDTRGSALFDDITRLPEYYLTRAERRLLTAHAGEIAAAAPAATLVELGSGTSDKTPLLLDPLLPHGLTRYVPFDVSETTLRDAAERLVRAYDGLAVHAVAGDFRRHLAAIPTGKGRRLFAFLGSTIGNLDPAERRRLYAGLAATMAGDDRLLLGADLVKDRGRLLAAYDDPHGVTAEFNRNMLHVLNRELHAEFEPESFAHVAVWDEQARWIEMRLRSTADHVVRIHDLDLAVPFAAGEDLRTETSAKFTPGGLAAELADAGLAVEREWSDGDFLLALALRTDPDVRSDVSDPAGAAALGAAPDLRRPQPQ